VAENRKCHSPPRNNILHIATPYTDIEPSNSTPQKLQNFFNNGLWLYRMSYSNCLNKRIGIRK